MLRKIIRIDQNKCNGCGLCVNACHEGAIGLVDGKAKLLRDDFCDGLGDCLPVCPTDAISFEQREAAAYDEAAVKQNQKKLEDKLPCGCPGTHAKAIERKPAKEDDLNSNRPVMSSELSQWPVQLKLVPVNAPYFKDADLLIAADCTAFAYGNFHQDFIKNKITIIGCPKLDNQDYSEKLKEIISNNELKSLTVVRMEVPCCSGIANAAEKALAESGKNIPLKIIVISTDGKIIKES